MIEENLTFGSEQLGTSTGLRQAWSKGMHTQTAPSPQGPSLRLQAPARVLELRSPLSSEDTIQRECNSGKFPPLQHTAEKPPLLIIWKQALQLFHPEP